jgi:hypothetical protein
MAKTRRNTAAAAILTAVVLALPAAGMADELAGRDEVGRVRSSSPVLARLITQASEHSAAFRALVDAIDASDSFVYVSEGSCGHGVRACFVNVTAAGSFRIMWVTVSRRGDEADIIGSIGHELRHTLEVIEHPKVRSFAARAAVAAGETVRAEVRKSLRRTGTDAVR